MKDNQARPATEIAVLPIEDLPDSPPPVIGGTASEPLLRGSICTTCSTRFFPTRDVCFVCTSRTLKDTLLGPTGTLYSFTTVHVSTARSTPYNLGYIDLDEGVRVLSLLLEAAEDLVPDMPVRLAVCEGEWSFVSSPLKTGVS